MGSSHLSEFLARIELLVYRHKKNFSLSVIGILLSVLSGALSSCIHSARSPITAAWSCIEDDDTPPQMLVYLFYLCFA